MENKYIIDSFLQAARQPLFQHRWMTAETWAELIARHYQLPEATCYSGQKLVNALSRCKWLNALIETRGVINNSICLYRNKHRPKGGKQMHCFYSAPKGETPIGDNATSNWFLKITTELLNVKVTRSNCLNLEKKNRITRTIN